MTEGQSPHRVEMRYVAAAPAQQVERSSVASEVEVNGTTLPCLVCSSSHPFLEALCGHEVISLESMSGQYSPHEGDQ